MTQQNTPFDHRPDRSLGAALRAALSGDDEPAFVARVLARAGRPQRYWEVLASWSRAGITAAAAAGLIAGFLLQRHANAPTFDDVVAAANPSTRMLLGTPRPPDPSFFLASVGDR
jgi:hypothetical protein